MDAWSLQGVDQLIDTLYRSGKGKTEIAALAILCDVAYDKEDKTAFQIMEMQEYDLISAIMGGK